MVPVAALPVVVPDGEPGAVGIGVAGDAAPLAGVLPLDTDVVMEDAVAV